MNSATKPDVDRIAELAALIAGRVPFLIEEARAQINESINATMEEAHEKEYRKAILSLAITAKWDLDGNNVVISMPVSVKRRFESVGKLDDPNQPALPGVDPNQTPTTKAARKFIGTIEKSGEWVTMKIGGSA